MTTAAPRTIGQAARATTSHHASQDEAIDRLYWLLTQLDPKRTVTWGIVERRAVARVPDEQLAWRLAEGTELERIIDELRAERVSAA